MPRKSKKSLKKRQHQRTKMNDTRAPGDLSLGVTEDWVLNDATPIRLPTGYDDQTLSLSVSAGLNGFAYKIFDTSGNTIGGASYLYGQITQQFNNIGSLYTTYRLNRLQLSLHQSSTWASVNQTPIVSCIDSAGGGLSTDVETNITNFSRMSTFQIHKVGSCTRTQDYRSWLTEVIDHPYIQTIQPNGSSRELYSEDRAPAIQMASGFTKVNVGESVVMILHTKAYYQFRGRRQNLQELPNAKIPMSCVTQQLEQVQPSKPACDSKSYLTQFGEQHAQPQSTPRLGDKSSDQLSYGGRNSDFVIPSNPALALTLAEYADYVTRQKSLSRFGVETNPGPGEPSVWALHADDESESEGS